MTTQKFLLDISDAKRHFRTLQKVTARSQYTNSTAKQSKILLIERYTNIKLLEIYFKQTSKHIFLTPEL